MTWADGVCLGKKDYLTGNKQQLKKNNKNINNYGLICS